MYKLIIGLLLIGFCNSCRRKEINIHLISNIDKNWLWIDTGSYFIYEDSLHNLDSIFVKKVEYVLLQEGKYNKYESYTCTLSNDLSYSLQARREYLILYNNKLVDYVPNVLFDKKYSKEKNVSLNGLIISNIRDTIYKSYSTSSSTFDSTIVWHIFPDHVMSSKETRYYFSKGVGISRIIDFERNIDKKLIRYKINPFKK